MTKHLMNTKCPKCGHEPEGQLNADINDSAPNVGDLTVCARCTLVCRFNEKFFLEPLTPEAFSELDEKDKAVVASVIELAKKTSAMLRKRDPKHNSLLGKVADVLQAAKADPTVALRVSLSMAMMCKDRMRGDEFRGTLKAWLDELGSDSKIAVVHLAEPKGPLN